MTFDNGDTEILLAKNKQETSEKKPEHFLNKRGVQ
jgi:hypothetical protein